jgi:hypothetical protein
MPLDEPLRSCCFQDSINISTRNFDKVMVDSSFLLRRFSLVLGSLIEVAVESYALFVSRWELYDEFMRMTGVRYCAQIMREYCPLLLCETRHGARSRLPCCKQQSTLRLQSHAISLPSSSSLVRFLFPSSSTARCLHRAALSTSFSIIVSSVSRPTTCQPHLPSASSTSCSHHTILSTEH